MTTPHIDTLVVPVHGPVVLLALLLLGRPAVAGPQEPATNDPEGGFIALLRWDNDAAFSGLFTFSDSDRYYTAGLRVGRFATALAPAATAARPLAILAGAVGADRVGWGATPFALDLYSPGDITRAEEIVDDRPYAGFLRIAGDARLAWDTPHPWRGRAALAVGVVGPASLGEQAQTGAHRLARYVNGDDPAEPTAIPDPDPAGWAHQVGRDGSLLVPQLTASVEQRAVAWRRGRLAAGASWHAGLDVGRATGSATVGATVRAGLLDEGFGRRRSGWEVILYGRIEGTAVAWNLFLDGGGGSHGVEREPLLLATEWGVSVRWRRLVVHWSAFSWSREQEEPPPPVGFWTHLAGRSPLFEHRFGRIEVSWLF